MRSQTALRAAVIILVGWGAAQAARAQGTQAPAAGDQKDQKPAPKPRKVWTNDDLAQWHPADANIPKTKDGPTAGAAAVKQNGQDQPAPSTGPLPTTLEETDKLIKSTSTFANDEAITVARVQKELDEAPEDQKEYKRKELERHLGYMKETNLELKAYQDRRRELEKTQAKGQPQSPSQDETKKPN